MERTETTEAASAGSTAFYRWEVPGKSFSIQLSYDALDRLRAEASRGLGAAPRRGLEVGGILLGAIQRVPGPVVSIVDFAPVPCEYAFGPYYVLAEAERRAFREAMGQRRRAASGDVYAVGYYRSQIRDGLVFGEEDRRLFSACCPDEASVALVIKLRPGRPAEAGLFFRENGDIRPGPSYLPFVFDREALGGRAQHHPQPQAPEPSPPLPSVRERNVAEREVSHSGGGGAATHVADVPLPSFLVAADERQERKPGRRRHILLSTAVVLAGIALGTLIARQFELRIPQPSFGNPYALDLMVLEYGDNLHLTWNRDAPAIRDATAGILVIADGDQSRSMELDAAQLRSGSVIYRRMTTQVRFRLEVMLQEKRSVSESWEALPPALPDPSIR
jgi:hypothetical protein